MTTLSPRHHIRMLERSLRCFAFSFLGLIPILGLPLAVSAIVWAAWVQFKHRQHWNPAGVYVNGALALGFVGVVFSLVVFTVLALAMIEGGGNSDYAPLDG